MNRVLFMTAAVIFVVACVASITRELPPHVVLVLLGITANMFLVALYLKR